MNKQKLNKKEENKQCDIHGVVNWVSINDYLNTPDRYADVIAILKDGSEIKLEFECEDGFCDESGTDYTEEIIKWRQV
tara:strand:+ start:328 stop:561 length:234 start_codon:yes stop_codon:yes gene_type:complete